MNEQPNETKNFLQNNGNFLWVELTGVALISLGILFFIAQRIAVYWLPVIVVPILAVGFLIEGIRLKRLGLLIAGGILGVIGIGSVLVFLPLMGFAILQQVGIAVTSIGLSWFTITLITGLALHKPAWWPMIPGGIITAIGCCLLFSQIRVVDFVLYFSIGLGLVFLIWGLVERLFGLIIPGCLLLGIGPGVNIAWGNINQPNGLTQTGVMLVWFALSWIMITVFSRAITAKFVWWPLIPGGILAVVGWGLYLGGDPKAAVGFIGNSGSIGLILFGVYLLLLRRSIRH